MTNTAMVTVDPKKAYALVVGIETYQLGAEYDLDGPARDGLRFIDWLLSHNVLPGNIRFFVSPLAQNADVESQAVKRDIKPFHATRDAIDKFIRDKLMTARGEVLYVFWGGHGALTKTHQATRQLLFSDTTATNKLNLNIGSLAQALGTSKNEFGFEKQLFAIDACANSYFQGLYEVLQGKSGEHQYVSTGETLKMEQVVMFACADYEVAKNVAGTGVFSSAVLAELKDKPLFPYMKALMDKVCDRLSLQGMSEPFYLWTKVGNQETISNKWVQYEQDNLPLSVMSTDKLSLGGQSKVKRLQLQLNRIRQQHDAESALLGESSGALEYQREQTLERLEEKMSQLEAQLREVV